MENRFSIPGAIVIAGVIIAGAIFLTNRDVGSPVPGSAGSQKNLEVSQEIAIRPRSADEHILGNPSADIVVVEFSDTECPFCKQFHTPMHQLIDEFGKDGTIAWVYRHFPIPQLHPKAAKEGQALECATEQGGNEMFWKYTDLLYQTTKSNNSLDIGAYNLPKDVPVGSDGKPYYVQKPARYTGDGGQLSDMAVTLGLDKTAFEECLSSEKYLDRIETDYKEAVEAGGRGTPYSVAILKKKLGSSAEEAIKSLSAQFPADTIVISKDKTKIGISGALPYSLLRQILMTAVGR